MADKPIQELTIDRLLDLYEIYCARHGRMIDTDEQAEGVLPFRAEIKRRVQKNI